MTERPRTLTCRVAVAAGIEGLRGGDVGCCHCYAWAGAGRSVGIFDPLHRNEVNPRARLMTKLMARGSWYCPCLPNRLQPSACPIHPLHPTSTFRYSPPHARQGAVLFVGGHRCPSL